MTPCMCLVQEGQITEKQQTTLRSEMTGFANRAFGFDPDISWIVVAEGSGFTEAKPSTSVLVSMTANRALSQAEREPLLRELGDIWMDNTGRNANEVVTVIRDPMDEE